MAAETFTYSGNVYTAGVAGTTDFALVSSTSNPIGYLELSHIHVYKSSDNGATWTELARPAGWDFISSGTEIRLASGISAGEWVKVKRITPVDSSYVTFQASSLLTAEQLNDDTLFNTYLNQERFDQGAESDALAQASSSAAVAAAASASAAQGAAVTAATDAAAAAADAAAALSQSTTALADSATALTQSAAALTDSASALAAATSAASSASAAVTTATAADTKADSAIAAISTSAVFVPVANVAAIPASPADGDGIQVEDSAGIESFTPLANLPTGFVGESGLIAKLRYSATGSTWEWLGYAPADSDARYVKSSEIGSAVEAYDPTILRAADIGSSIQAYDPTILKSADIGSSVEPYDATILRSADIGSSVQAYDVDTAKLDLAQTWTQPQTFNQPAIFPDSQTFPKVPQNSRTSAYILVAADAGRHISITTGGVTVPPNVLEVGDAVSIYNNSGSSQSLIQGAGVTLRLAGSSVTGNRTIALYGLCTVLCVASNTFVVSGAGLS